VGVVSAAAAAGLAALLGGKAVSARLEGAARSGGIADGRRGRHDGRRSGELSALRGCHRYPRGPRCRRVADGQVACLGARLQLPSAEPRPATPAPAEPTGALVPHGIGLWDGSRFPTPGRQGQWQWAACGARINRERRGCESLRGFRRSTPHVSSALRTGIAICAVVSRRAGRASRRCRKRPSYRFNSRANTVRRTRLILRQDHGLGFCQDTTEMRLAQQVLDCVDPVGGTRVVAVLQGRSQIPLLQVLIGGRRVE